jgi:hypothetical protein
MLRLILNLLQELQGFLQPIFFVSAWVLLFLLGWTLVRGIADLITRSKKMHAIPCTNCKFFTNDYRLKCTVQPRLANTEQAVSCPDFRSLN